MTCYLDGLFLWVDSQATLTDNVEIMMGFLQDFSWVLNLKKSALTPTGRLECLCLSLENWQMSSRGF